ncbi:Maf-like protein-domain-containing protein, partial [Lentinula raphanica]
ILDHALPAPAIKKLASNSPRRRDILKTIIGLAPDIIPSPFEEDLSPASFADIHEYPVATASHKAVEVYERLVLRAEDPDNAPDLIIAADTVQTDYTFLPSVGQELLEKPKDEEDNLRMIMDLNAQLCEVVIGVTIAYPILAAPGYALHSIDERSLIY